MRLGTGWTSLLPAALAREALTPQTPRTGPGGYRAGLGWLLLPNPPGAQRDQTAVHSGGGVEAVAFLRTRVRGLRTHVVLTSRGVTVESIDGRLLRSWLTT